MKHWLHHIVFDPLSAWEKFQLDMFVGAIVVGIFVLIVSGLWISTLFETRKHKG